MIFPFNSFTLHDLLGFTANGFLAVTFYVLYWKLGRRRLDLLSANFLACWALSCLSYFLSDNVVPAGLPATGWPHGPTAEQLSHSTLFYHRISWVAAMLGLVTQFHFVLEYSHGPAFLRRNIRWFYLADLLMLPLIWSPAWTVARQKPLAETSSWDHSIPYLPEIGLPGLLFAVAWWLLVAYSVLTLYRKRRRMDIIDTEYAGQHRLVLLAFLAQLLGVLGDVVSMLTTFDGPPATPVGSTVMGLILAVALIRARLASDRRRQQLEQDRVETLRTTNIRLLAAREEERRHVAKELHDSVAQSLLTLQLRLGAQAAQEQIPAALRQELSALGQQCREAIQEVRHLCEGLYPAALDLAGLPACLERVLEQWRSCGKNGTVDISPSVRPLRFSPEVEIALFRACQEAIHNAMRHAAPQSIALTLDYQDGCLAACIQDDGIGFEPGDCRSSGLGMSTMRSRIEGVGGWMKIASAPGQTRVEFHIPCSART